MGIVNVTPDSFSDGGDYHTLNSALTHADTLIEAGADILDIGGESTRPYAEPVDLTEELTRTIPVIEGLRAKNSQIPISIDTTKAEVARQALAAGANIVNDISALRTDPEMVDIVRTSDGPVVIMHMQGNPADMQDRPEYGNVIDEIVDFFYERIAWLVEHGIKRDRIIIDPGIGFGKTPQHNLSIIKHLGRFKEIGQAVLLGHSRKSFLGPLTGLEKADERDLPSAVISALAATNQVDIIRVHNVAVTKCALQVAEAILQAE